MKNKVITISLTLLVAIFIVGIFFELYKGNHFNQNSDTFAKKQECTKYADLVNQKIKDSGRVFPGETYVVNEIFYSPTKDSCLYAFTINTKGGEELYSVYDIFGGDLYTGTIATEFQSERTSLKE